MRALGLCVAVPLAVMGLAGMAGVTRGGSGVALMPVLKGAITQRTIVPAASSPAAGWTPTPQPGLSRPLDEGESWKAPPVAAVHAMPAFRDEDRLAFMRICWCESRWDPRAIGTDGAGSEGACQVIAQYHGAVPADLYGQAAQAQGIADRERAAGRDPYGPWTTKNGCPQWAR